MPEENQPIQGAFGDIYRVETPHFDQALQQIQQNYADRRNYLQKENQNTEELLNKEMANVRSVDTPAIIDAYNDYKSSKQNQLFNRAIQTNPKAYAVAQMDANSKYANLMTMINKSSQYNEYFKQMAANRLTKPDNYSDDSGELLSTAYKTPMDQLTNVSYKGKAIDLTNPDNWRYQGGNFDFSKLHTTAVGKPVTHYDDGTTDASGVQTTQHGFQFGNTPQAYRNVYVGGLAGAEASRAARYSWNQHSANQQQLDALDAAYQNSPNWQKLGIQPQPLPPYNPNDPVGNEATYQAKQYLVSMNPAEVAAKRTVDAGGLANLNAKNRLNGQEIMEAIKEGNREKLSGMKHDWKTLDTNAQSKVLDDTIGSMMQEAQKNPWSYTTVSGQVSKQYDIPVSAELKKSLAVPDDKGHPILPDAVRYNPTTNTVMPIFYKPGQTGDKRAVDTEVSKPMTMAEFKAVVGKTYFGTREAAKETTPPGTHIRTSSGITWQ